MLGAICYLEMFSKLFGDLVLLFQLILFYMYIYVCVYMRKQVMLPFSSNINSMKLGKVNFLKSQLL